MKGLNQAVMNEGKESKLRKLTRLPHPMKKGHPPAPTLSCASCSLVFHSFHTRAAEAAQRLCHLRHWLCQWQATGPNEEVAAAAQLLLCNRYHRSLASRGINLSHCSWLPILRHMQSCALTRNKNQRVFISLARVHPSLQQQASFLGMRHQGSIQPTNNSTKVTVQWQPAKHQDNWNWQQHSQACP